ncbi:MAG: hypothetical protein ACTHMM_19340 [Agriterribacter sp.]
MIQQTAAKIYLAQERGCNENACMRSYSTFNFGNFNHAHKQPFSSLYVWNDDTLAPGQSIKTCIDKDGYIVFIPLVGTITYRHNREDNVVIDAGQVYISCVRSGTVVEVTNSLSEALVNFLHIRIAAGKADNSEDTALLKFDIDANKYDWVTMSAVYGSKLVDKLPFYIAIAKLGGRSEVGYTLRKEGNAVFAFSVEGAFEVQNRLLHQRDGLALWDTPGVELEALSNDAIIILFEVPLTQS